jgi:hypothetical protein
MFRRLTVSLNGPLLPAVASRAAAILRSSAVARALGLIGLLLRRRETAEPPLGIADDPAGAKHSRPTLTHYQFDCCKTAAPDGLVISGQRFAQSRLIV